MLRSRLEAGRQLFNAVRGDLLVGWGEQCPVVAWAGAHSRPAEHKALEGGRFGGDVGPSWIAVSDSAGHGCRHLLAVGAERKIRAGLAATRANEHGQLANQLLAQHGPMVHAERISYRALQHAYGRSVRDRAPGRFTAELGCKARQQGGGLVQIPTWNTYLSQRCQRRTPQTRPGAKPPSFTRGDH